MVEDLKFIPALLVVPKYLLGALRRNSDLFHEHVFVYIGLCLTFKDTNVFRILCVILRTGFQFLQNITCFSK